MKAVTGALLPLYCVVCRRDVDTIPEYRDLMRAEGYATPTAACRAEDGTYNHRLNLVCCTACYVAIGMPNGLAQPSWAGRGGRGGAR